MLLVAVSSGLQCPNMSPFIGLLPIGLPPRMMREREREKCQLLCLLNLISDVTPITNAVLYRPTDPEETAVLRLDKSSNWKLSEVTPRGSALTVAALGTSLRTCWRAKGALRPRMRSL